MSPKSELMTSFYLVHKLCRWIGGVARYYSAIQFNDIKPGDALYKYHLEYLPVFYMPANIKGLKFKPLEAIFSNMQGQFGFRV